jgi:hypothetical protein
MAGQKATPITYDVIVGNIGTVHSGRNLRAAERVFREYVKDSKRGYGRAAGEAVTIMRWYRGAGDVMAEYPGTLEREE